MHTTHTEINIIGVLWSLGLAGLVVGIFWYKLHLMRLEIHRLVESLPQIGSEFIREQMKELRQDMDVTRARVRICEQKLNLDGL